VWSGEATELWRGGTEVQEKSTFELTDGQVVDDLGVFSISQAFYCLEFNQYVSEANEIGTISHAQWSTFVQNR